MSLGETAFTLARPLPVVPGLGLGTTVQEEPSQCSMRVWLTPLPRVVPTAQALQADSTVTPLSALSEVPGLGGCPDVQPWQTAADAVACQGAASAPASISGAASAGLRSLAGQDERAMDDRSFPVVTTVPHPPGAAWDGPRPGSAAVQGEGLGWAGAGEAAHGPGVAGGGGGDG